MALAQSGRGLSSSGHGGTAALGGGSLKTAGGPQGEGDTEACVPRSCRPSHLSSLCTWAWKIGPQSFASGCDISSWGPARPSFLFLEQPQSRGWGSKFLPQLQRLTSDFSEVLTHVLGLGVVRYSTQLQRR